MKRRDFVKLIGAGVAATGLPTIGAQHCRAEVIESQSAFGVLHKIEFDTDEGTWMSLDVSPDGQTIVFDLLGQLYALPISGGRARKISNGDGFFSQPRFGSHGQLVYVSDLSGGENIWRANSDGSSPQQISRSEYDLFISPIWTADGKSVLVSRQDSEWSNPNLWMYDADTGASVQLTHFTTDRAKPPEERKWVLGAVPAPDGGNLYFAESLKAVSHDAMLPLWQIVRFDLQTKKKMAMTEEQGSAFRPVLSPDGTKLVYGTRYEGQTGLRICELATGESRWLVYPVDRDEQESIAPSRDILPGYAFTPEGKYLIVSYGGKIHSINIADGGSRIIPFQVTVSQPVKPTLRFESRLEDQPHNVRLIQSPELSPDGRRLAFSALSHIYVTDMNGGRPGRLTAGSVPEYQPSWSPDGRWVAYVSWGEQGGHIWKARTDGTSGPVQLTSVPAYYRDLAWTPDGTKLVALRTPRQVRQEKSYFNPSTPLANTDLVWLPTSGGSINVITAAYGYLRPHFAATADRIYVTAPEGLVSLRLDGSDYRHHLKIDDHPLGRFAKHSLEKAIVVSPDGGSALTTLGSRLNLVALGEAAPGGDKPLTIDLDAPGNAVTTISRIGADYFGWADAGATITWSLGATLFRLPRATNPARASRTTVALEVEPYRPETTIVLRRARVITMGRAGILPRADIVIQGNRIASVGPTGQNATPINAKIIPADGMTIIPGLIESHAHFSFSVSVLDLAHSRFPAYLAYGVTTVRDPQSGNANLLAYLDLLDAGRIAGPRVFTSGPGILSGSQITSLEDAVTVVRKYKEHYRTSFIKAYVLGNRQQRRWVIEACRQLGMMTTTEGAADLKLELTHAIDGFSGNEHSYGTMPLYKDVVELLARTRIYTTPTLTLGYGGPSGFHYFVQHDDPEADPRLQRFFPPASTPRLTRLPSWFRDDQFIFSKQAATIKAILRAGGNIALGTDSTASLDLHWAMQALATGRFTPLEVLRIATLGGAKVLGYEQDLGSIEPGKLADLVVLTKNPLEDLRNTTAIKYVMKNGVLYDGETLNQVWPATTPRPLPWWITYAPPKTSLKDR